jgi:hypothetical protein
MHEQLDLPNLVLGKKIYINFFYLLNIDSYFFQKNVKFQAHQLFSFKKTHSIVNTNAKHLIYFVNHKI